MKSRIKISIIIPTFNREKTIVRSINSVLNQTYPYFEIIVVDDCSSDNTLELVNNIKDERVRYVKNHKNLGAAATRNVGVKKALYDYIAFQDSDDEWIETKLEKQVDMISDGYEYSMIYTAFMYANRNKVIKIPDKNRNTYELLLGGNSISTQTMLIKKECFLEIGGFNEELRALEDWDLAIRFAEKYKIGYIDEALVNVYYSENSVNFHNENLLNAQIYIINSNIQIENRDCFNTSILCMLEGLEKGFSKYSIEKYKPKIVPSIINNEFEFELLLKEIRRSRKFEENYNLLVSICELDNAVNHIEKKLNAFNVKNIAIYGAGKVGKQLANIINMSELTLDYLIDQNEMTLGNNIKVIKKEDLKECTELIIVSIPIIYSEIKEDLKKYTNAKIIYLKEILE